MAQFTVTFGMAMYNCVEFKLVDPLTLARTATVKTLARSLIAIDIHTKIDELLERVPANEVLLHDSIKVGVILLDEPEMDFRAWVGGKFQMLQEICSQYKDHGSVACPCDLLRKTILFGTNGRRFMDQRAIQKEGDRISGWG